MPKIDFFITGAQKASTTSLHRILQRHPQIFLPDKKELEFFSLDELYEGGESYLDLHYRAAGNENCIGLSDVQLAFLEGVPERLHAHNPEARLILTCRNPIDRAYSAYWYLRNNGREAAESFEAAIDRELELLSRGKRDRADQCYLEHGHYAEQINRFLVYFQRKHICILLTDDMRSPDYLQDLVSWLGLAPADLATEGRKKHNKASAPRFAALQRLLRNPQSPAKRAYKQYVPQRIRHFVTENIVNAVSRWNMQPSQYPPMQPETRDRLRAYFADHNRNLGTIIHRDLDHWD